MAPPGLGARSMMQTFLPKYAACAAPFSPAGPAPITTRSKCSMSCAWGRGQRVFRVGDPAALVLDDQLYFRTERYRQVRVFVSGRKVHQHRHVEVLDEV